VFQTHGDDLANEANDILFAAGFRWPRSCMLVPSPDMALRTALDGASTSETLAPTLIALWEEGYRSIPASGRHQHYFC